MSANRWPFLFCALAASACVSSHLVGDVADVDGAVGIDHVLLAHDLGALRDARGSETGVIDAGIAFDGDVLPDVVVPTDAPIGVDMPLRLDAGTWCDATAAGCGTVDAGPILSWEAFLPTASSLICDASMRCDGHLSLRYGMLFCQPRYIDTIPLLPGGGDVRPTFDPTVGQACIDALSHATSCVAFSGALRLCDPLFYPRGTVGAGEPCAVDHDCAAGHCDLSADIHCEGGRCVAWVDPGAMCGHSRECPPGLGCTDGVCGPRGAAGSACTDDASCSEGLFCDAGTCAPPHGAMDGCATDFACDDSLVCNAGGCSAGVPVGASCTGGIGIGVSTCTIGSTCFLGRCRARVPTGSSCRYNEDCPYDSGQCYRGTCVLRPTIGDACTTDGPQCIFSACVGGVCSQFDVGGGPCNDGGGDRCLRGLYCDPSTHLCVRWVPEGGDCSAARCAAGTTCNPGSLTCGECI